MLLLPTWFAFAQFARTREMFMEMGSPALPGIARLAVLLSNFQVPFLLVSFAFFIAVLITCLRSRGGVFLLVFAGQLLFEGVLMTTLFLSSILVTSRVIQSITM